MRIDSLLDPHRYPHPVDRVELLETHISWIALAGEFAYKLKKPVTLPFLDYGSVAKRRACCAAELRLNRRYAPALYLDVVDFDGEPAVKMRRFDETARLDNMSRRGELTPAHLSDLARTVVRFHAGAEVAPAGSRFGSPAVILATATENFDELDALLAAEAPRLARLRVWTGAEFARRRDTMARRKQEGRVRECHGDLHLGNLVLLGEATPTGRPEALRHAGGAGIPTSIDTEFPVTIEHSEEVGASALGRGSGGGGQRVVPFDCIEFNDDLRWIDVANEIAFTYVDLLDHGRPGLAGWLLNEWLAWSGDFGALALLPFYAVYRAVVRAKVAALRHQAAEAAGYLAMAEDLTLRRSPTLTITFGLSGSGKTTASTARLLADPQATTIRLRSDVERKRLFGLAADADSGGAIYSAAATAQTYARLAQLAGTILGDGWSVIVDAAFLKRAERDAFRALAAAAQVPCVILACAAPIDELRRRLDSRQGDASEAGTSVLDAQLGWLEPLAADEGAIVGS